jgi:hypothetical protein
VPALQQVGLLAGGGKLYLATPRGLVERLDPETLAPGAVVRDGAAPRSLALSRGRLLFAGAAGVTAVTQGALAPLKAAALPGASMLAGGDGAPVAAIAGKRVCVVDPSLVACATLAFAPSGVGVVRADSSVVVADAAGGTVTRLRRGGSALKPGSAIPVGPGAHGPLLSFSGKVYVSVKRGIAVVDPSGKTKTTVIKMATSPSAIWISWPS